MDVLLPTTLIDNGTIPQGTLIMVIMLPVIATMLGFARHIIGIKSLGLYAPIILTYAYFRLGLSAQGETWSDQVYYGIKVGLILSATVLLTSYLAHIITKQLRVHYFPKIALVLTAVATSVYVLIIIADLTDKQTFQYTGFLPIILIATISEQFVSILAKKNLRVATSLTITTVLLSMATFSLVIFEPFQNLFLDYPYLIIVTILINMLIGRFTGLRISEYLRFKDILNQEE